MLIRKVYTLKVIYLLNFTNQVILNVADGLDFQQVVRVDGTFGKFVTGFDYCAVLNFNSCTVRNQISFFLIVSLNDNFTFLLCIINRYGSCEFGDDCKSFRLSCFKKLLYTGKTLCNITTRDTTGMESCWAGS